MVGSLDDAGQTRTVGRPVEARDTVLEVRDARRLAAARVERVHLGAWIGRLGPRRWPRFRTIGLFGRLWRVGRRLERVSDERQRAIGTPAGIARRVAAGHLARRGAAIYRNQPDARLPPVARLVDLR